MLRIIELLGLLAPIGAVVLLVHYRRRSRAAFGWGIAGCLLAALASGIGVIGHQASVATGLSSGAGVDGVLDQMGTWAWARFLILVLATGLLVVAALVDRPHRNRPMGWILGGLALGVLGVLTRVLDLPIEGHEGLTVVVEILLEAVEAALLGLAVLALAVAAVANRSGTDSRPEPTDVARRAGMAAWRLYNDYRGSRYR